MRNQSRQVDVSWSKEVELLKAGDGLRLDDGIGMILHHGTANEAVETCRCYRSTAIACCSDVKTLDQLQSEMSFGALRGQLKLAPCRRKIN